MIAEIVAAYRASQALARVRELLTDVVYTREGVQIWLSARNKNLGHQAPLELILTGFGDLVVAEAERLAAL